jgi:hypothetical protein
MPADSITDPSASYNVTHNFNFTPAGNIVAGAWNYRVFTSASAPLTRCGALTGTIPMPANNTQTCTSTAGNGAMAVANSSVSTANFAPGNVTGTIHVDGSASVPDGVSGSAFSSARSTVGVRGGSLMRNGRIRWGPGLSSSVSGSVGEFIHDPITFDVLDPLTGIYTSGTLEDIESAMTGTGSFSWNSGVFSVNATSSFTFTIDMTSPYIQSGERGSVDFQITNGMVTTSATTGIFAGLFPSVGSAGTFSMPLSNDLTLDYDLGSMGGAAPLVTFGFDDGGEASVPEPASFLLLATGLALLSISARKLKHG